MKNAEIFDEKTELQLPVDEFPSLNGGYATNGFAIITANRKEY